MRLSKKNYVERDASWMYFNRRILDEARREDIPLMERLNYLGIYSNNLDEFFRVRVATLNRIVEYAGKGSKELRKRSEDTLKTIGKLNAKYAKVYEETVANVTQQLHDNHIHLLAEADLSAGQQEFVRQYCLTHLTGALSPVWLEYVKDITNLSEDAIHLAIRLQHWTEKQKKSHKKYAIIELPVKQFGRFVQLPDTQSGDVIEHNIMYLDDVVRCALPYLFPGTEFNQVESWSFKVTKDAEMELESNIRGGTLQKVSKGVKSRKKGLPVRFIYDQCMPREVLKKLVERLDLLTVDTMLPSGRYQNHKDLMKFPRFKEPGTALLEYPKWPSVMPQWTQQPNLMDSIRQRDRFLHVPYHSFGAYIKLLREAAVNPEVKGIKTTLYRLAKDSKVISALVAAARNGKKVTVVIELLARFDEESNIDWSKKMEDAGINVLTGVDGLKIHSKVTLITARGGDVAVISTGNFHEGNACTYTDFMQLTARQPIVRDVERVFEFIEKPYMSVRFKELIVSPNDMRRQVTHLINQEIHNHNQGHPAYILCKLNHVTDEALVKKIYEAAMAGVKVDLLVRGNCSLVTDLPELGGNLRVNSIIDRYLEHSRILIFANGTDFEHPEVVEIDGSHHDYKVFIGSADWMPRNLDHRIEVYAPVYDNAIKREARLIVEAGMRNERNSYRSQEELYKHYQL
ncbi:MAG: RNA degradosome polyphosphate kinase [Bacteroidales bacterium]|nr:RNA degradosome polyphosphate kinase [Bacteroidales bacterium]